MYLFDKLVWANLGDTRNFPDQNQGQQSSQRLPNTAFQVSAHTFKLFSYNNMFNSNGVIIPQHVMQQRTSWFLYCRHQHMRLALLASSEDTVVDSKLF